MSWGHIPFSHCLTLDKLEAEICPMPLPSSLYAIQGHMTSRLGLLDSLGFCNSYLLADIIKPGVPSLSVPPSILSHTPRRLLSCWNLFRGLCPRR